MMIEIKFFFLLMAREEEKFNFLIMRLRIFFSLGDFEFCRNSFVDISFNDLFGILLNDPRVVVLNLYFSKREFISPF